MFIISQICIHTNLFRNSQLGADVFVDDKYSISTKQAEGVWITKRIEIRWQRCSQMRRLWKLGFRNILLENRLKNNFPYLIFR